MKYHAQWIYIENDLANECSECILPTVPNKPYKKFCINEITNCEEYSNDSNGLCEKCSSPLLVNIPHKTYCISKVEKCSEYTNDSTGICVKCE